MLLGATLFWWSSDAMKISGNMLKAPIAQQLFATPPPCRRRVASRIQAAVAAPPAAKATNRAQLGDSDLQVSGAAVLVITGV